MIHALTVVSLFICSFFSVAAADVVILRGQGNSLVPITANTKVIAVEEPQIAMEEEVVRIEPGPGGYKVRASFWMRSYADVPLARTVGFPFVYSSGLDSAARSFTAEVSFIPVTVNVHSDGVAAESSPHYRGPTDPTSLEYPGFISWPVTWQPHETKLIECSYDMMPEQLFGFAYGWRLRYIVRTGALWRGNIGRALFTIKLPDHLGAANTIPAAGYRVTYPQDAEWVSPTEVQWHFTNWNPIVDLLVEDVTWRGVEGFRFHLPPDFVGATQAYSEFMLTELVKEQLKPYRSDFPAQVEQVDQRLLKSKIAEALYYEFYARHGDPFYLALRDEPRPPSANEADSHGYYGQWGSYFRMFKLYGLWYRPDPQRRKVAWEEFNPIEQANLTFLRQFFTPSHPPD